MVKGSTTSSGIGVAVHDWETREQAPEFGKALAEKPPDT